MSKKKKRKKKGKKDIRTGLRPPALAYLTLLFHSRIVCFYSALFSPLQNTEKRREVAKRIQEKYPDLVPVIVEKARNTDAPDIDKKKYLVPRDITVGKFVFEVRRHMSLKADKAIFLFVDNVVPPTGALISTIYDKHKDEDGFLYVTYSGESTFGGDERQ